MIGDRSDPRTPRIPLGVLAPSRCNTNRLDASAATVKIPISQVFSIKEEKGEETEVLLHEQAGTFHSNSEMQISTSELTGQFDEISKSVAALAEEKNSLIAQLRQSRMPQRTRIAMTTATCVSAAAAQGCIDGGKTAERKAEEDDTTHQLGARDDKDFDVADKNVHVRVTMPVVTSKSKAWIGENQACTDTETMPQSAYASDRAPVAAAALIEQGRWYGGGHACLLPQLPCDASTSVADSTKNGNGLGVALKLQQLQLDSDSKRDELGREVARLNLILQAKDMEIDKLRQHNQTGEEHCKILLAELGASTRSLHELRAKVGEGQSAIAELEDARIALLSMRRDVEIVHQQMIAMEKERETEKQLLEGRIVYLDQELVAAGREVLRQNDRARHAMSLDGMLGEECKRLEAELEQERSKTQSLTEILEKMQNERDSMASASSFHLAVVRELTDSVQQHQQELLKLQGTACRLEVAEKDAVDAKVELDKVQKELEKALTRCSGLEDEVEACRLELCKERAMATDELAACRGELTCEVAKERERADGASVRNSDLEMDLESERARRCAAEQDMQTLSEDLLALAKQHEELRDASHQAAKRHEELRDASQETAKGLRCQLEQCMREIQMKDDEREAIEGHHKEELNFLHAEWERSREEHADQLARLHDILDNVREELRANLVDLHFKDEHAKALRSQLMQISASLAEHLSSLNASRKQERGHPGSASTRRAHNPTQASGTPPRVQKSVDDQACRQAVNVQASQEASGHTITPSAEADLEAQTPCSSSAQGLHVSTCEVSPDVCLYNTSLIPAQHSPALAAQAHTPENTQAHVQRVSSAFIQDAVSWSPTYSTTASPLVCELGSDSSALSLVGELERLVSSLVECARERDELWCRAVCDVDAEKERADREGSRAVRLSAELEQERVEKERLEERVCECQKDLGTWEARVVEEQGKREVLEQQFGILCAQVGEWEQEKSKLEADKGEREREREREKEREAEREKEKEKMVAAVERERAVWQACVKEEQSKADACRRVADAEKRRVCDLETQLEEEEQRVFEFEQLLEEERTIAAGIREEIASLCKQLECSAEQGAAARAELESFRDEVAAQGLAEKCDELQGERDVLRVQVEALVADKVKLERDLQSALAAVHDTEHCIRDKEGLLQGLRDNLEHTTERLRLADLHVETLCEQLAHAGLRAQQAESRVQELQGSQAGRAEQYQALLREHNVLKDQHQALLTERDVLVRAEQEADAALSKVREEVQVVASERDALLRAGGDADRVLCDAQSELERVCREKVRLETAREDAVRQLADAKLELARVCGERDTFADAMWELEDVRVERDTLLAREDDACKELEALRTSGVTPEGMAAKDKSVRNLRKELAEREGDFQALRLQLEMLSSRDQERDGCLAELSSKLAARDKELEVSREQVQHLQSCHASAMEDLHMVLCEKDKELEMLRGDLAKVQSNSVAEVKELLIEREGLERRLGEREEEVCQLKGAVQENQAHIARLMGESASKGRELAECLEERDKARSDVHALSGKLAGQEVLRRQLQELTERCVDGETARVELVCDKERLQSKLSMLRGKVEALQSTVASLEAEMAKAVKHSEAVSQERERLVVVMEQEREEATQTLLREGKLLQDLDRAREDTSTAKEQVRNLCQKMSAVIDESRAVLRDKDEAVSKWRQVTIEKDKLSRDLEEQRALLEDEKARNEIWLEQERTKMDVLQGQASEVAGLKEQVQSLVEQVGSLCAERDSLSGERNAVVEESMALVARVQVLEDSLAEARVQADSGSAAKIEELEAACVGYRVTIVALERAEEELLAWRESAERDMDSLRCRLQGMENLCEEHKARVASLERLSEEALAGRAQDVETLGEKLTDGSVAWPRAMKGEDTVGDMARKMKTVMVELEAAVASREKAEEEADALRRQLEQMLQERQTPKSSTKERLRGMDKLAAERDEALHRVGALDKECRALRRDSSALREALVRADRRVCELERDVGLLRRSGVSAGSGDGRAGELMEATRECFALQGRVKDLELQLAEREAEHACAMQHKEMQMVEFLKAVESKTVNHEQELNHAKALVETRDGELEETNRMLRRMESALARVMQLHESSPIHKCRD